jgi:hypothetical protein
MEFTDFNELKRLMKEGSRLRGGTGDSMEGEFEFENTQDIESYHKHQIYSYANASSNTDN